MPKQIHLIAAACLGALAVSAAPASAQSLPRTWVSSNGSDVAPCARAQPCRTFQFAHNSTNAGGLVSCVDSGDYGSLIINKSITIKCTGVMASIVAAGNGIGISINAGATDKIVIDGLDIEGLGAGLIGIACGASGGTASKVHVLDTTIQNFTGSSNNGLGIVIAATNTHLFLDNSFLIGNSGGVGVGGTNNIASLTNSSVRASSIASLLASTASAIIGVQNSVINDSPVGISNTGGGQVISVGPNNLVTGAGAFTLTIPYQ